MHLARPEFLGLLVLLPLIVVMARRSLAGAGPVRTILAITLRCLTAVALILALAELASVRRIDDQTVIFVLDTSRSVPAQEYRQAAEYVRQSAAAMRPEKDRIAVLQFAGGCAIAQLPGHSLAVEVDGQAPDSDRSDLARALRLAAAIVPPDTSGRIVLFSDGNENQGSALKEVKNLRANNIPVDVLPCLYGHDREVVFETMTVPATANQGEPVRVGMVLRSLRAVRGRIVLYEGDRPIDQHSGRRVELHPGTNRLEEEVFLGSPGLYRFRAEFIPDDPADDGIAANNSAVACALVRAESQVLILADSLALNEGETRSVDLLAEALRRERTPVVVADLADMTLDTPALLPYSAVILSNVPISSLNLDGQGALAAYTRDLGGGLVAIGGDQSFSAGGYAGSLLEAVLPVQVDRQRLLTLNTAMVIVLDRSGSMAGEKIDIAKKSAIGSMELLSPFDYIGLVSFDVEPVWNVPLMLCANKTDIRWRIGGIAAGGGTDMFPAMTQAGKVLRTAPAAGKHMILLTDGQSQPADFEQLARELSRGGITISTIAVGPDADRALLHSLAKIGGGRFYAVESLNLIPRIFARETALAGRSGVVEETFTPQLRPTLETDITSGIDPRMIPPLHGYVIASARPEASTGMVRTHQGGEDPILAWWRVGLGKSVAFTSGSWPRWGRDWVAWSGFSKLWTQAVRWVARTATAGNLEITTRIDGNRVHVVVQDESAHRHVSTIVGGVTDPANRSRPLVLTQVGPGEFEGVFTADTRGNYVIQAQVAGGGAQQSAVAVVGVAYSPEYRELRSNIMLLRELSQQTGGRLLDRSKPETVFRPERIGPISSHQPLWNLLLRCAMFAFLADVAVRRLAVDPRALARRWQALRAELAGRNRPVITGEPLVTLKAARDRARAAAGSGTETADRPPDPATTRDPRPFTPPAGRSGATPFPASEDPFRQEAYTVPEPRPAAAPPESPPEDSLARLLAVRRRRSPADPQASSPPSGSEDDSA